MIRSSHNEQAESGRRRFTATPGGTLNLIQRDITDPATLANVRQPTRLLPSVVDTHDLRVWALTADMDVATLRRVTRTGTDLHPDLDQAQFLFRNGHNIAHANLPVEPDSHTGCHEVTR